MLIIGSISLKMMKAFVRGLSLFWACCKLPKTKLCPTTGICLRLTPCNRGIWDLLAMQPLSHWALPPRVPRQEMTPWSCPRGSLRAQTPARSSEDVGTILCIGVILEKRGEHRLGKAYGGGRFPLKWSPERIRAEWCRIVAVTAVTKQWSLISVSPTQRWVLNIIINLADTVIGKMKCVPTVFHLRDWLN